MNVTAFDLDLWHYRARLDRIIDADTYALWVDLGFSCWAYVHVRLAGVDAPERYTEAGRAATAWVAALVAGRPLRLHSLQRATLGRWLGDIHVVEADGELLSLGDALVTAGHATYRDGAGPVAA